MIAPSTWGDALAHVQDRARSLRTDCLDHVTIGDRVYHRDGRVETAPWAKVLEANAAALARPEPEQPPQPKPTFENGCIECGSPDILCKQLCRRCYARRRRALKRRPW